MVTIHAEHAKGYLMLTEGYLPEMADITAALTRTPKFLRKEGLKFESRDEALAHTLKACAHRLAYHRQFYFGGMEMALGLPLDTWLIGPPQTNGKKGELAAWFAEIERADEYRLIINHSPRHYQGLELPPLWGRTHKLLRGSKKLRIEHRQDAGPELRVSAQAFLKKLDAAYAAGRDSVESVLVESGHDYWPGSERTIS